MASPVKNNFKDNPSRAKSAGKKSKRPPSIIKRLSKKLQDNPKLVDQIVDAIITEAIDGTTADRKLAIEYLDGKVVDKVEMTGADGGAIETVKLDPKKYAKARRDMIKKDDV